MPDIVILCPLTAIEAPTGLTTEVVQFDTLPKHLAMQFRCPHCKQIHAWSPQSAWVTTSQSSKPSQIGLQNRRIRELGS
jgi:hypothetical protein